MLITLQLFLSARDFQPVKIDFETDVSVISYSLSNEVHYWRTYPGLRFKGVVMLTILYFTFAFY